MKKVMTIFEAMFFATFIFTSCGNNSENNQSQSIEVIKDEKPLLQPEYLGNYNGIQQSYFMKNQYGDDMVINGQKISVPSIDFKFLLKEDGFVSLQQTNLDDNSRVYYDGSYKILNNTDAKIKIECSFSDGQSSKPIYTLVINKSDNTTICIGKNEPEFKLEKKK